MSVIPARSLAPGDRFLGLEGSVWVVLSTSPHSDVIRVTRTDDGAREPRSLVPPADRMVTVLNRDDSLTTDQATDNLRKAGLLP